MNTKYSASPTCSEERRQLESELAIWSEFASACAAQVHSFCAAVTVNYLALCLALFLTQAEFEGYQADSEFIEIELELELIQTQMTQKPMLRAEVGMCVRCANNASAE